jgi:hypothetical protein
MEERLVACNCAQAGEMGGWNGSVFLLLGGSMIRIVHLRPWNFGNDFYGNFLISTVLAAPWIRRAPRLLLANFLCFEQVRIPFSQKKKYVSQ